MYSSLLLAFVRQAMDSPKGTWRELRKHSSRFQGRTKGDWFWPGKGRNLRIDRGWGARGPGPLAPVKRRIVTPGKR